MNNELLSQKIDQLLVQMDRILTIYDEQQKQLELKHKGKSSNRYSKQGDPMPKTFQALLPKVRQFIQDSCEVAPEYEVSFCDIYTASKPTCTADYCALAACLTELGYKRSLYGSQRARLGLRLKPIAQ